VAAVEHIRVLVDQVEQVAVEQVKVQVIQLELQVHRIPVVAVAAVEILLQVEQVDQV
tara:strand:- start:124 stop:294 length:171 start_codon:yes stop_codon:yes gene_type:complete